MPMMRILRPGALACALLAAMAASAQRGKPDDCPARSAECEITTQVLNFGRHPMTPDSPPVSSLTTVAVTCTRAAAQGTVVEVPFELQALPAEPTRYMRDNLAQYLRYFVFVDPARTRNWGDGTQGTEVFVGRLFLDDRNRVGTLAFPVYGQVDGGQIVVPNPFVGLVLTRLNYQPNCRLE
jgi:spore coat protein U-like protein